MWAVLYDDGTSLTTASERIARSLAEAERQRGRRVTVRRLDDDADSVPERIRPAERFAGPKPMSEPEPAPHPNRPPAAEPAPAPEPIPAPELTQFLGPTQVVEPMQAVEPASVPEPASEASPPELTREPEPARAATPTRGRRLLFYALAAASIVVAAALADHWDALPEGATYQLQSDAGRRSRPSPAAATSAESAAGHVLHAAPSARRPAAESPQSATGESSGGGPSAIARGG